MGDTGSYNESRVFEDWQGTPALSTIEGIFAAARYGIRVAELDDSWSQQDVNDLLDFNDPALEAKVWKDIQDGYTVTVPVNPVIIEDPDGNEPAFQAVVRLSEKSAADMKWAYDWYDGSQSASWPLIPERLQQLYEEMLHSDKLPPEYLSRNTVYDKNLNIVYGNSTFDVATYPEDCAVGDPVNIVTGEFYLEELPDLSASARGLASELRRTYRSRLVYKGPFGFGWAWSHSDELGFVKDGGTLEAVLYRNADREVIEIAVSGSDYTYPPGSTFDLEKHEHDPGEEDDEWVIAEKNGFTITFDAQGRLTRKHDRNGNALTFIYNPQGQWIVEITLGPSDATWCAVFFRPLRSVSFLGTPNRAPCE